MSRTNVAKPIGLQHVEQKCCYKHYINNIENSDDNKINDENTNVFSIIIFGNAVQPMVPATLFLEVL